MKIVVIKYNAGNIRSVLFALERIGFDALVTDDADEIMKADKVIFPGVGEASTAIKYLRERELDKLIFSLTQPVLGICLGMQLMCSYSEENDTHCMGVFNEVIKKFKTTVSSPFKIPQTGWNNIYDLKSDLFSGVNDGEFCYFVHSYFAEIGEHTIATTNYIQPFSSALQKNNFYGVQFHPEKSAVSGQVILQNFLNL